MRGAKPIVPSAAADVGQDPHDNWFRSTADCFFYFRRHFVHEESKVIVFQIREHQSLFG